MMILLFCHYRWTFEMTQIARLCNSETTYPLCPKLFKNQKLIQLFCDRERCWRAEGVCKWAVSCWRCWCQWNCAWGQTTSAIAKRHSRVQTLPLYVWYFRSLTQYRKGLGHLRACLLGPPRSRWRARLEAFASNCNPVFRKQVPGPTEIHCISL